jgi:hypothetical protein
VKDWKIAPIVVALMCVFTSGPIHAETSEVLKEISETADRLCGYVAQSGHSSTLQLSGDVKAELSGLAKKLADLGVSGTGDINSAEYEGVVQQELTGALKDVRECKLKVFDTLQKKLVADTTQQAARDPDGIYQARIMVGKAFGARRLPTDATTFEFVEITNCAQFNTSSPFYFHDIKLRFVSEKNSAFMIVGRPDSPIRFGVLAKVVE